MNIYNNKYKSIIGFEPDKENFEKAKQNLKQVRDINLYNCGVGFKSEHLKFDSGNKDSSKISENGDIDIKVINIDSMAECKETTFIKMDIEGAEPEALRGAEEIIKKINLI